MRNLELLNILESESFFITPKIVPLLYVDFENMDTEKQAMKYLKIEDYSYYVSKDRLLDLKLPNKKQNFSIKCNNKNDYEYH